MAFVIACDVCGRYDVTSRVSSRVATCGAEDMTCEVVVVRSPGWRFNDPQRSSFPYYHVCPRCAVEGRRHNELKEKLDHAFDIEE